MSDGVGGCCDSESECGREDGALGWRGVRGRERFVRGCNARGCGALLAPPHVTRRAAASAPAVEGMSACIKSLSGGADRTGACSSSRVGVTLTSGKQSRWKQPGTRNVPMFQEHRRLDRVPRLTHYLPRAHNTDSQGHTFTGWLQLVLVLEDKVASTQTWSLEVEARHNEEPLSGTLIVLGLHLVGEGCKRYPLGAGKLDGEH